MMGSRVVDAMTDGEYYACEMGYWLAKLERAIKDDGLDSYGDALGRAAGLYMAAALEFLEGWEGREGAHSADGLDRRCSFCDYGDHRAECTCGGAT